MDRAQHPSSEEEDDDDDDEEAGSSSNDESSSVVPQRDVDGPEVKPLRAARTHCNDVHGYRNEQQQQQQASNVFSEPAMPSTSSSSSIKEDVDAPAGGRLRFFFAGRCVLELAHDTDGRGRPKQWTQTATFATSPRPTTWIPSASTSGTTAPVLQPEKVVETALPSSNATLSPASSSSSPVEETAAKLVVATPHEAALGRRGSFLPFTILRRSAIRSSPDSCTRRSAGFSSIDPTLLRRAARRPFRLLQASLAEESQITNTRPASRQKRILAQKMQRLDWLAHALLERSGLALSRVNEAYVTPPGSSAPYADLSSRCHPEEADSELALKFKLPTSIGSTVPIPSDAELQELMKRQEKRDRPTGFDSRRERRRLLQQHRRRQQQQQLQHLHCSPQTCQVEERDSASHWKQNLEASSHSPANQHPVPFVPPPPLHLPSSSSTLQRPSQRRGARGRTIGEAVRNFVIHEILDLGGDPRTKYVPRGVFTEVGLRHKVDATTTYRWWLKYCNSLRASLDQADGSSPPNLNPSTEVLDRRGRPRSASYFGDAIVSSEFLNRTAVSEHILSTFTALNPISSSTSPTAAAPAAVVDSASVQTAAAAAESKNAGWPPALPALLPLSSSSSSPPSSTLPFQQHQQQQHQHDSRRRHHRRHRFSNDVTVPSATSSDRSHPTTTLPVGVCLPYVWNGATTSSSLSVNKLQGRIASNSSIGYKTSTTTMASEDQVLDEPLDLTIPKKKIRSVADDNVGDEGLIDLSPFKPVVLGERLHVAI